MASQLSEVLRLLKFKITKYDPSKSFPISLNNQRAIGLDRFAKKIIEALGTRATKYPEVWAMCVDPSLSDFHEELEKYIKENKIENAADAESTITIPEEYAHLTLNLEESHVGKDLRFFMTTEKERISQVSGYVYLRVCNIPENEALNICRRVISEYRARSGPGIVEQKNIVGEVKSIFNSYITPQWMDYEGELPDRLPPLFKKLVYHLFPLPIEREYFFNWLYASLFNRAFVYLVLCGAGGTGKNRLKLVMRALHGFTNTVDGKRSTLVERFNSQLADSTLAWFDELHYTIDTENVMKEIQNDTISIERKNFDATRSTKIYASLAISNNKPRDNYIAFDARKFAPLVVSPSRLDTAMTTEEITELTNKVENWESETFDIAFIAQIGRWIQKHGWTNKWPTLEYKGPMFFKLAHTSMTRWQKKAAAMILEARPQASHNITYEKEKGFLWSTMEEASQKKNGDKSLQFPEFSTVKYFFDIFVDGKGVKAFETLPLEDSIMGDFWVKVINPKAKILNEAQVIQDMGDLSDDSDIKSESDESEEDLI